MLFSRLRKPTGRRSKSRRRFHQTGCTAAVEILENRTLLSGVSASATDSTETAMYDGLQLEVRPRVTIEATQQQIGMQVFLMSGEWSDHDGRMTSEPLPEQPVIVILVPIIASHDPARETDGVSSAAQRIEFTAAPDPQHCETGTCPNPPPPPTPPSPPPSTGDEDIWELFGSGVQNGPLRSDANGDNSDTNSSTARQPSYFYTHAFTMFSHESQFSVAPAVQEFREFGVQLDVRPRLTIEPSSAQILILVTPNLRVPPAAAETQQATKPLLIVAEDVEGEALGAFFQEFGEPRSSRSAVGMA